MAGQHPFLFHWLPSSSRFPSAVSFHFGTVQDAIAGVPIGLNGIAKTIIGYLASSLGVKLDVDNPGSRFLMTFVFYLVHRTVYVVIALALVGVNEPFLWAHTLVAALANGLLAVVLFALFDRLKQRP